MRKTRFFYFYQLWLLGVFVGLAGLSSAAAVQVKEKEAYLKQIRRISERNAEKNETEAEKPEPSPAVKPEASKEEKIRVLLMTTDYGSYFHREVTGSRAGKSFSYDPDSRELESGPIRIPAHEAGIQLTSLERQCGAPVYEGTLEITKTEQGLTVVNELPLEAYLEAVVPSEMPSSYEREALKAQAVCARTYAWRQIQEGRLTAYGADVDDSVNFQVYRNIEPQETATEAVRETRGQILCHKGEPVQAYYFSTSSGATSTDEIWGAETPAPYLKSVSCEFDGDESWSRWETVLSWEILQQRASERIGGTLLAVTAAEKNESSAVTGLQVATEEGSFMVEGEYEVRQFLSPEGEEVTDRNGTESKGGSLLPSAYFTLRADPGKALTITGGGYGHGVGMSQNGANGMAGEGYTCPEILDYFFKDVQIETLY